jgi:micrococcal nuclease
MSKRQRTGITAAAVLLAAFLIWFDRNYDSFRPRSPPRSRQQTQTNDFEKYHCKTFMVKNVVDGDTLDIDIPDGQYDHTRIRLWGVDTPEIAHPGSKAMYFGPEAAEFARNLTLGKRASIYLDEENRTRDKYGRLLAYVKLTDGRFLNEVLLSEGYAYADVRFEHVFYHKYQQLESTARSLKKGLWRNVTHDQLPQWLQREKPNVLMGRQTN